MTRLVPGPVTVALVTLCIALGVGAQANARHQFIQPHTTGRHEIHHEQRGPTLGR